MGTGPSSVILGPPAVITHRALYPP